MLKTAFLDYLAKANAANLRKDRISKLERPMLSAERRLLHREATADLVSREDGTDTDIPWNRIANLHENYRRHAWKRRGLTLDLSSPNTLAEKIEWLKFNNHDKLLIRLCDKLAVRDYVLEKTRNPRLLNRIIGGGAESIDGLALERLPQKYVVKSNHWSGDALICSGANPIPTDRMREIDLRLNSRYGGYGKSEWPYWHIAPRVFVEEYLEDQFGQLVDYKIFCFNGEPKLIMICKDRQTENKKLFFDSDWKLLPITDPKYPTIDEGTRFPKPESLHEMLDYCSRLCEDVPFVRADFYDVEGDCRFGELTLYPECGIDCRFQPAEWNAIIGGWLDLPESCRNPKFAFGPEYAPRGSGLGSRR